MNSICNYRCIRNTLSEYLSDSDINNICKPMSEVTGIKFYFKILKYENDSEWFVLINSVDNESRLWFTIFQDPYESTNRIVINDLSLKIVNKDKVKKIIDILYDYFYEFGRISVYSNNKIQCLDNINFIPDSNNIYLTYNI